MQNNGLDLAALLQFVNAVRDNRDLGKVTFCAHSDWDGGTRTLVKVNQLLVNQQNAAPAERDFTLVVDEPHALGGTDQAPNPMEYLAAGLCGCITAGIATNGALFNAEYEKIAIDAQVVFDVAGVFGIDKSVPNGALEINLTIRAKGPAEQLSRSKATIDGKSPAKAMLEFPVKINTQLIIEE